MMGAYNFEAEGLVEKTDDAAAGGFRLVAFTRGPKEKLAVFAR